MAAPPPAVPKSPPVTIEDRGSAGFGNVTIVPPTFLEKWGVVFVAVGGGWMLSVCIAMLWYYLAHLSLPPALTSAVKPEDYKALLDLHKTATDRFRDALNFAFDLMVTKTILPLLTLMLGYLFGSKKS